MNSTAERVYLDYAATAPLRAEVRDAMLPWLGGLVRIATSTATPTASAYFGNANALYREGREARQALEKAREQIAAALNVSPTEIVFTSGGTEANNAAVAGITRAVRAQKGRERGGNHILASAFEHHALLEPVQALKRDGWQTSLVKPRRDGRIHSDDVATALRDDTALASIMLVNNELGTVQPVRELAALAHERGALFHTDAVQALGKLPCDLRAWGVDAASFSAHKIGGPSGIGALYLKGGTPFLASMLGGNQEARRRSGTQNVASAVGFACALGLVEQERPTEQARLAQLYDQLATELQALDPRITLTVGQEEKGATDGLPHPPHLPPLSQLPTILSVLVKGFESETLILALDEAGFAVSGGAACSTGSLEPSHVLMALGLSRDESYGVLRLSLGRDTTTEDCAALVAALARILRARI